MNLLKLFTSKAFLLHRSFLWLLFIVNLLGTIYGYYWYKNQLVWTVETKEAWMLPFVPDSPTSSLFFTIAILYLLFPPKSSHAFISWSRSIIEALAVVCSIKYGVWATAIIVWGAAAGDQLNWQSYMLMTSHIAMAVEVLLYVRFFTVNKLSFILAFAWLLLNDWMDYTYGIYPWLPYTLHESIEQVKWFTFALSICSFLLAYLTWLKLKKE